MSEPFKSIIEKMPIERQERIKQKAKELKTQMAWASCVEPLS